MPTLERFKKQSEELIRDIQVYQSQPDLVNPYRVIEGIAEVLKISSTIILPQTQTLKLVTFGIKLFSAFLNGYSKGKNE